MGKVKRPVRGRCAPFHTFFYLLVFAGFLFGEGVSAEDPVCDLSQAKDGKLQQQLVDLLVREDLTAAVRRGELALTLLVLTDPDHPQLAQVNGNRMMYAASLPKILVLLGAAVGVEEGRLRMTVEARQDLNLMVRRSCNDCTNRMIDWVGEQELVDLVRSPRYQFYDLDHGGLWIGKPYGPNLAWERDPLYNLSHGATTFQIARFYCGLERGTLVGPKQTKFMLEAMTRPGINHKFVKGLNRFADGDIYRKSGTWTTWHADSALVHSDKATYVIAGLAHSPWGGRWLERLAMPLNDMAEEANSGPD